MLLREIKFKLGVDMFILLRFVGQPFLLASINKSETVVGTLMVVTRQPQIELQLASKQVLK